MTPSETGRFFLPGPTEVHPDVLAAQTRPMIGHRGRAIEELLARIASGLAVVFQTRCPVIVSASAASGLMEAAIRNGVHTGPVLALVNGAFSSRFASIARACGREVDVWEVEWGQIHDLDGLAERLRDRRYEAVTVTHSESSTGALQDLEGIASVVAEHPDTLLLVDSVTGIGAVEVRPDDWGIDFILTGSQKALALPPGLAFAVPSEAMMERAATIPDRGWYFDLVKLVESLEKNQTPATPAVSLLYALDAQLERILEEGIEARWERHRRMQALTVEWAEGTGLGVFAVPEGRSPTVTCVNHPEPKRVVSAMAERGWTIGGGYGKIQDRTFRIGHMGDHTVDGLKALLAELDEVVA
ncbi:MAG: alanine--glyoxylate aminotransferase family protein [Actinomycetes bacterium]|jgi:aspartate aminotransferase-like enzyme|nr:MAG: aminotransferase [Actinomycetota bacterium]